MPSAGWALRRSLHDTLEGCGPEDGPWPARPGPAGGARVSQGQEHSVLVAVTKPWCAHYARLYQCVCPRQAGCLSEVQSRFQGTHYATPPGLAYPHGLRKPSHRAPTNTSQHPLIHLPNQTSVATIPRTRQVQSMDGGSSVTLRWLVSRHNSYILLACSLLRGQYDKASFSSLKGYFFVCSEK